MPVHSAFRGETKYWPLGAVDGKGVLAVSIDHLTEHESQAVLASEDVVRDFCALSPSAVLVLDSS